ncbi:MAG: SMC family ATPase [Anaerolineales bacterium]|jgi:exonuclease SbcC
MIPVRLELQNFLAYRHPDPIDFEGVHVACLCGENGAGKSSLLDAITWTLWGKARGRSVDDLIHLGEREMRTSLVFELEGTRYRVIRQRRKEGKGGSSLLEFQVCDAVDGSWRSLSEHTLRETEEKIVAVLQLDYETFVNSAFLAQGRADEFTAKPPSQRLQILANILGLDQWQTYENRAKESIHALRQEMQRAEGRREAIQAELARREEYAQELLRAEANARALGQELQAAEQAWSAAEAIRASEQELARKLESLVQRETEAASELHEAEQELAALRPRGQAEALQNELAELERRAAEIASAELEIENLREEQQRWNQEVGHLRGENEALTPQSEPIKQRLALLQSSADPTCPTCGQPLTLAHREQVAADLERSLEDLREKFRNNAGRIHVLQEALGSLSARMPELQTAAKRKPELERRRAEINAALQSVQEAHTRIRSAEARRERWQTARQQAQAAQPPIRESLRQVEEQVRLAEGQRRTLDQARLEKRLADERVGGARQRLATLEQLQVQEQTLSKELQEGRARLALLEELREAFNRKGVPTMIIETAVPELEETANALLSRMSEGRMNLRLDTQRETKEGEARESLEILIGDELGTRAYEMYSGGEAFRINFAIRIALSKLLAQRAGAQLRALFIDEGFGTQDSLGRERMIAVINSIQEDFDRILVVSHLDEIRDAFPTRIEVVKSAEGSLVRVL